MSRKANVVGGLFLLIVATACRSKPATPIPNAVAVFGAEIVEPTRVATATPALQGAPEGVREFTQFSLSNPSNGLEILAPSFGEMLRRDGVYLIPVIADLDPDTILRAMMVPAANGKDGVAALFVRWGRKHVRIAEGEGRSQVVTHDTLWRVLRAEKSDGKIRVWALEGVSNYFANCKRYIVPYLGGEFGGIVLEQRNVRQTYCAIVDRGTPPEGMRVWDGAEAPDGGFWILYAKWENDGYHIVIDRFDRNAQNIQRIRLPKPILRWTFMTPDGLLCGYLTEIQSDNTVGCYRPDLTPVSTIWTEKLVKAVDLPNILQGGEVK